MSPAVKRALVGGVALAALFTLLASTGPRPDTEYSGVVRRLGGPCLELERWDLFGWNVVGQTYSVEDTMTGDWHDPVPEPPCAELEDRQILVRLPADAPNGVYRLCGVTDDRECIEFRRVPFEGSPGP